MNKKIVSCSDNHFDLIIIGSGIGALSLASFMAQIMQWKVLILEQHYKVGGFTHVFPRKDGYSFDVGLHYVGEMNQGNFVRRVFDFITARNVSWTKMTEPFERFSYPDSMFSVYGESAKYQADLLVRFPEEKKAIRQYFRDISRVFQWQIVDFLLREMAPSLLPLLNVFWKQRIDLATQTTEAYLRSHIQDSRLRSILASQWGTYGLPPAQSAFATHAMVAAHYLQGGYYPVGGSEKIANSIIPIIESSGGEFRGKHRVERIILEQDSAIGVEVVTIKKGLEHRNNFYAPKIVSNVGVYNTYKKLLERELLTPAQNIFLESCFNAKTLSTVVLYIGFKSSPEELGFKGENHWIFTGDNHDLMAQDKGIMSGDPAACYLSFPSIKDPESKTHTAEAITFAPYSLFDQWAQTSKGQRGPEYAALKEKISQGIIALIESRYPGFRGLIDFYELATPLTNSHYTLHPAGSIYGMPGTPSRFSSRLSTTKTPIKNLFIVGADAFASGIVPSMLSGLIVAASLSGRFGLLKTIGRIFRG